MTAPTNADVLASLEKLLEIAERVPVGNQDEIDALNRGEDAVSAVAAIIEERDALRAVVAADLEYDAATKECGPTDERLRTEKYERLVDAAADRSSALVTYQALARFRGAA